MDGKHLGKIIKDVALVLNSDNRFGPVFTLSMNEGDQVDDTRWALPPVYKATFTKSEGEWSSALRDAYSVIYLLMRDAKVTEFSQLKGKPIEVTIEGNALKHWRILTEVI